jgi:hypothetical protein
VGKGAAPTGPPPPRTHRTRPSTNPRAHSTIPPTHSLHRVALHTLAPCGTPAVCAHGAALALADQWSSTVDLEEYLSIADSIYEELLKVGDFSAPDELVIHPYPPTGDHPAASDTVVHSGGGGGGRGSGGNGHGSTSAGGVGPRGARGSRASSDTSSTADLAGGAIPGGLQVTTEGHEGAPGTTGSGGGGGRGGARAGPRTRASSADDVQSAGHGQGGVTSGGGGPGGAHADHSHVDGEECGGEHGHGTGSDAPGGTGSGTGHAAGGRRARRSVPPGEGSSGGVAALATGTTQEERKREARVKRNDVGWAHFDRVITCVGHHPGPPLHPLTPHTLALTHLLLSSPPCQCRAMPLGTGLCPNAACVRYASPHPMPPHDSPPPPVRRSCTPSTRLSGSTVPTAP